MAIDSFFLTKVERALKAACQDDPKVEIDLEEQPPDMVGGQVLSNSFGSLSPSERQDRIWDFLDRELNEYERTRISFIVTDTPEEHRILTAP